MAREWYHRGVSAIESIVYLTLTLWLNIIHATGTEWAVLIFCGSLAVVGIGAWALRRYLR